MQADYTLREVVTLRADLEAVHTFFLSHDWTQGTFAKNRCGDDIEPRSAFACSWCLTGAVLRLIDDEQRADALYRYLAAHLDGYNYNPPSRDTHPMFALQDFNDRACAEQNHLLSFLSSAYTKSAQLLEGTD